MSVEMIRSDWNWFSTPHSKWGEMFSEVVHRFYAPLDEFFQSDRKLIIRFRSPTYQLFGCFYFECENMIKMFN